MNWPFWMAIDVSGGLIALLATWFSWGQGVTDAVWPIITRQALQARL